MAVKVQSTIEPYNDSYKAVNAKHVGVGEGANEKSLDEVLKNLPGGGDITVDSELSLESENPVQNKVVTQEFRAFNEVAGAFNERLSTLEKGGIGGEEYEIPTFDLVALGLPTIIPNGQYVRVATDTAEIIAALEKGAVKIIVNFNMGAEIAVSLVLNPASVIAAGEYSCTATSEFDGIMLITTVGVGDGYIAAKCTPMDNIIGAYIDAAIGGDY